METHYSPLLTLRQLKIARAQSGITLRSEEGELGADFTDLGSCTTAGSWILAASLTLPETITQSCEDGASTYHLACKREAARYATEEELSR